MVDDIFGFETPDIKPVEFISVELENGESVNIDTNSDIYGVAKNLTGTRKEIEAINEKNAAKKALKEQLRNQLDELQKQKDLIAQQIRQIDNELFDDNRKLRELNAEVFRLRRLLQQALENEKLQKKLLDNKVNFDKRIVNVNYSDRILEHQRDGAFILATNMRCILGDKRGAGKTLTAIAAWDMAQCQRVLVIVPDDVVSNFVNEIHYWAPHRNVLQVGKMPKAQRDFAITMMRQSEAFTCVVNYSAWRKDKSLIEDLISLRFDTVVMDEAHEIKNTSTAAYKGCSQIILAENCCPMCSSEIKQHNTVDGWSNYWACVNCEWKSNDPSFEWEFLDKCSVKMVIPMSGTVILNKPQDLFALLSLVDPINFKELKDYLRVYCQQNPWTGKWEFKSGGLESLQKKLSGKYIARDGVATPGQSIYTHDLEISPEEYPLQHKVIEQLTKHAEILMDSGKKMTILATIALITRKRQANVWPGGITLKDEEGNIVFSVSEEVQESIKVDKCISYNSKDQEWEGLLPEFTESGNMELGSRVVVFSQFKGPLKELESRLNAAGIKCVRFDGDTPQHIRDEAKIDFDRKYCDEEGYQVKYQVLLANYRTGGVGLNFTAATETIILDREWNPGKEDQAFGRTDRLGQTEHTNVHILRIPRTIDVWMDTLIDEKANLINGFNEATESLNDRLLKAMKNGDVM